MRRTRAYVIKAQAHRLSTQKPDIETQPSIVAHRVTPAVALGAGSIYQIVVGSTSLQLIPAYSSQSSSFEKTLAGIGLSESEETGGGS